MGEKQYTIALSGCAPIPLAHYLKALGVLRLVSEQADRQAKGWWEGGTFHLQSTLDREGLVEFFLERYAPTPLVGPWGARSGFYSGSPEKAAREALASIRGSDLPRLTLFRSVIIAVNDLLHQMSFDAKPDSDEKTLDLLVACRGMLNNELLSWFDATYVLLDDDKKKYPPLLGTGGNEGSGSYMSGFAQNVVEVVLERKWDHALDAALFDSVASGIASQQTPGHFFPNATGGSNAGSGFEGSTTLNPWDYLLLLEGTICFAGACAKRLESHSRGVLAFPFCAHATGVGYGSATADDTANHRPEMWLPIWRRKVAFPELKHVFSEGRAIAGKHRARTAIDFARAVASLGVDKGIDEFERYGFQLRNGDRSNFSVSLGRFHVKPRKRVNLLVDIERNDWLDRFRLSALKKNKNGTLQHPRAARMLRPLEAAIFELCQCGDSRRVQDVLIALGQAEAAVAISSKLRDPKENVSPVPPLSPQWLTEAYIGTGDIEFRLAAALASIGYGRQSKTSQEDKIGPFRRHIEPIKPKTWRSQWPKWAQSADDPGLVWGGGSLVRNLLAVLNRRMIDAVRAGKQSGDAELLFPGKGCYCASLGDIAAFIDGRVDDRRIESLVRGLILINWHDRGIFDAIRKIRGPWEPMPDAAYALLKRAKWSGAWHRSFEPMPDAAYALLKLCHLPYPVDGQAVPLTPAITRRAASGDLTEATRLAARRLRASGLPPAVKVIYCRGERARRTAAALLFPVWHNETKKSDVTRLMELVLRDRSEPTDDIPETADPVSAVT